MRTLWSFLLASVLLSAAAAYADDKPAVNGGDPSANPSGAPDDGAKKPGQQACVAALDKDYETQKPQLTAALKGKPLEEYWKGECGKDKEPKEIVSGLLTPGGVAGGKQGAVGGKEGEPPGKPAMSEGSVNAVGASVGRIGTADLRTLFDGGGGLGDVHGPGVVGMGAMTPVPPTIEAANPKITPQFVRDTLAAPGAADEKRSSDLLQTDFQKAFAQTAHGRELLKEWKAVGVSGVPILIGPASNPNEGASYRPDGKFYTINSVQLEKSYDWAKGKDESQIASYLTSHPRDRAQMVYDLQDTMLHEGWHSAQMAKYPLHGQYDIPDKDWIQLEYEAKMKGAGSYMERVEAERKAGKDTLAKRDNVFVNDERNEAIRLAYQGPDAFNRYVKQLYLGSANGADISEGIRLQKARLETASAADKPKLEAGLKQLTDAKTYFDAHIPVVGKSETKAAPVFLIHRGMDMAATKPNDAMTALYSGTQDARKADPKWFQANRVKIIDSFNTAIDAEKVRMSTECRGTSPACTKREEDLKGSCKYIGRDPC